MNIETRLNKLEEKLSPSGAFCVCDGHEKTSVVMQEDDNQDMEPLVKAEQDKRCEKCRKPLNSKIVLIEVVESALRNSITV